MAIVKYHNHMNEISFSKFEKKELDLFFSICQKLKEKGTKSIQLDFSELKELSSYTNKDLDVFISDLKSTYDKMLKLDFTIGNDPHNFTKFNLFNEYTVSAQTKTVTIATNEKFSYILNEINPYTKFELLEFVSLKSKYSKNIFKKLKQYTRTYESDYKTLFWEVSVEEFRRLLDISDVYKKMSQLDKWVFKPILEELPPYFKNLKIQKVKQGKSISKLKFTWLKQYENNDEVIDITISQNLQDAFDKALRNRFIKEFLTEENKHNLISAFEEKDLIRGLKHARESISYAFKNLSYLENSIKKGLEKPIVKTTVVKTTVPEEEKNIVLGEQLSIKTKVTQKEYEECYQEFLKTNNKKNGKQIRASWEISVKNKFEIIEGNEEKKEKDDEHFPPNDFLGDDSELANKQDIANIYKKYLEKYNLIDSEVEKKVFNDIITGYQLLNTLTKDINPTEVFEYFGIEFNNRKRKEYIDLLPKLKHEEEMTEKVRYFQKLLLEKSYELKRKMEQAGAFSKTKLTKEFNEFEQDRFMFNRLSDVSCLDNDKALTELDRLHEKLKNIIGISLEDIHLERKIEKIIDYPCNIIQDNVYAKLPKNQKKEYLMKKVKFSEIPKEKLLSKSGKNLVGGALISRLKKIAKELGNNIELEDGEIILAY